MKKILIIFTFLLITCGISNAQYFSIMGQTGIALNLQSNSAQSVFGLNIANVAAQYTFTPLFATRFNFQTYLLLGSTTTNAFGFTTSSNSAFLINIKGDFLIGQLEKNSSMQYYGYIGPGMSIPTNTGGGGPYFHIDFGGGANFKIASSLSINTEVGFGLATSSPVFLYIPFRGGIKYDF